MAKPKEIIFRDGTKAKVYGNYKRVIHNTGSYLRLQLLTDMSSGFYEMNYIKKTDEMLLVEKATMPENRV